ncbi:unnamed protein product, partial [Amoebophrya sp. A120]
STTRGKGAVLSEANGSTCSTTGPTASTRGGEGAEHQNHFTSEEKTDLVDWLLFELKRNFHSLTPFQHHQLLKDLLLLFRAETGPEGVRRKATLLPLYTDLLHYFVKQSE